MAKTPNRVKTKPKGKRAKRRPPPVETASQSAAHHLKIGWWTIVVFVSMGMVLEVLHGFKIGWYLDVDNATRRQLLLLAHGFGVFFGMIHVTFAATAKLAIDWNPHQRAFASSCLTSAGLFIPGGLILAAAYQRHGLPGMGIVLALMGFALTLISVAYVARGARQVYAIPPTAERPSTDERVGAR